MVVGAIEAASIVARFRQHVPGLQEVVELQAVEIAQGLDPGHLHLHGDAPLRTALLHQARRLPKHGIRGPDRARHEGGSRIGEDGGHGGGVLHRDVVRGGSVVVGGSLPPVGGRGDDVLAPGQVPVQTPAGAEQDKLGGAGLPMDLVDAARSDGGPDGRKIEGHLFPIEVEGIDGGVSVAGADPADGGAGEAGQQMVVDLLGEDDEALVHQMPLLPIEGGQVDEGGRGVVEIVDDHRLSPFGFSSLYHRQEKEARARLFRAGQ